MQTYTTTQRLLIAARLYRKHGNPLTAAYLLTLVVARMVRHA